MDQKDYIDTVNALCDMLEQANLADTDQAQYWQRVRDSRGGEALHGHLGNALLLLAGEPFSTFFFETGERSLMLLSRLLHPATTQIEVT